MKIPIKMLCLGAILTLFLISQVGSWACPFACDDLTTYTAVVSAKAGTDTAWSTSGPIKVGVGNPVSFRSVIAENSDTISPTTETDKDKATGATVTEDVTYTWNFGDGSSTATGTSQSHSFSTSGEYTVTLTADDTPGCYHDGPKTDTIVVKVIKAEIKKVIFTSDHGLMTDEFSSFSNSGGTVYNPRGWVKGGANNPISHTQGASISANVNVCVEPSGESFTLTGESTNSVLNFSGSGSSTGSDQDVSVTASSALPAKIDTLTDQSITWKIKKDGTELCSETSSHTIYVTWGTPPTTGSTRKRIDWACIASHDATSISTAATKIRDKVRGEITFNGEIESLNAWLLMANPSVGADCYSLANVCVEGLNILGISADKDKAWATHDGIGSYPAVSASTCTAQPKHDWIDGFEGHQHLWHMKAVYTAAGTYEYEGFFTISDPGLIAYTVVPSEGPFSGTLYHLEVLRKSGAVSQSWAIDGLQVQADLCTFLDEEPIPALSDQFKWWTSDLTPWGIP